MDVKRYDYGGGMMEFDTGPYVRFDDYAALRAECDQMRERLRLIEITENMKIVSLEQFNTKLQSERDELEAAVLRLTEKVARLEAEKRKENPDGR